MSVMIARRIARPLPPPSPEAHREIAKSQVAEADAEKSLRTRWRIARICSEIQPRKGIRDLCAAVRCALDFSTIIRCRNIIYDIKKNIYIYIYIRVHAYVCFIKCASSLCRIVVSRKRDAHPRHSASGRQRAIHLKSNNKSPAAVRPTSLGS